jgi:hypothetical protein
VAVGLRCQCHNCVFLSFYALNVFIIIIIIIGILSVVAVVVVDLFVCIVIYFAAEAEP